MSLHLSNETRHRQQLKLRVFKALKVATFGKTIEQTIKEDGGGLPGPTRKLFSQLVNIRNRWDRQHGDFASEVRNEEEVKQRQFEAEDVGFPDAFQASPDGQHLIRLQLKGLKTWRPCHIVMDAVLVDPSGPDVLCPGTLYTVDRLEEQGLAMLVPTTPLSGDVEGFINAGLQNDGSGSEDDESDGGVLPRLRIPVVFHRCRRSCQGHVDTVSSTAARLQAVPPSINVPQRGRKSINRGSARSSPSGGSASFRSCRRASAVTTAMWESDTLLK
jgi:hypothetical protein